MSKVEPLISSSHSFQNLFVPISVIARARNVGIFFFFDSSLSLTPISNPLPRPTESVCEVCLDSIHYSTTAIILTTIVPLLNCYSILLSGLFASPFVPSSPLHRNQVTTFPSHLHFNPKSTHDVAWPGPWLSCLLSLSFDHINPLSRHFRNIVFVCSSWPHNLCAVCSGASNPPPQLCFFTWV